MRALRYVLPAALVTVLVFAPAMPAAANHDDDGRGENPDNADQQVERNSLTSDGSMAADHGSFELDFHTQIETSGGGADIRVFDAHYGSNGWAGRETCPDVNWWNGRCDHFRVEFNLTYMAGDSDSRWLHLGCHEFGHTGGIDDRPHSEDTNDNSCMHTWSAIHLDNHDENVINGNV